MADVIAAAASKGGVGKSSVCAHLATMSAEAGYLVLVIDLDPSTGIAIDLGLAGTPADDDGARLAHAGDTDRSAAGPQWASQPGRSRRRCRPEELAGPAAGHWSPDGVPRDAVARLLTVMRPSYDLIIINTAPGDSWLRTLAFAGSDYVVIPTRSDLASVAGIAGTAGTFEQVRDINPRLELLGVILFGVTASASKIETEVREQVAAELGGVAPVLNTVIRYQEKTARQARAHGLCVQEYERQVVAKAPRFWEPGGRNTSNTVAWRASGLATDYARLTSEIHDRLRARAADHALAKAGVNHG